MKVELIKGDITRLEVDDLKTITFPNISTGVYRFPKRRAAQLAIMEVQAFQAEIIEKVIFVCFDKENYQVYEGVLSE